MIYLDTYESEELAKLLRARIQVVRTNLNDWNKADIYWTGADGTHQIEMKSTSEVLGSFEHVEGQLAKQYYSADHSKLLIRGIIAKESWSENKSSSFERKSEKFFVRTRTDSHVYYGYRAWLESLDKAGIQVVEVPDMPEAVDAIMALYNASVKEDSQALKRYYREKIQIPEKNPHILALMYLSLAYDLKIGHNRATALIEKFSTLYDVLDASPRELCEVEGIGKSTANNLCMRWVQKHYSKQEVPEV